MKLRTTYLLLPLLLLLFGCDSDGDNEPMIELPTFDRAGMLEHWADNLIVPAFTDFSDDADALVTAAATYADEASPAHLTELESAFEAAYLSWQGVSPFMTGPGEQLRLREQVNIYPTNVERLVTEPEANLELPSNVDIQGFPALDYLLFGAEAVDGAHVLRLSERIADLAAQARDEWTGGYRDQYVANSGNGATASIDRTVNDYLFYYEKFLRAGKVGIPAGVFANAPLVDRAEAPYHGELSQRLFQAALVASRGFFVGEMSLEGYLDALNVTRDGEQLSVRIRDVFTRAEATARQLNADFATQIATDNTAMLGLYDVLQENVILLKIDMFQALGINVDFVDADGD